MIFIPKLIKKKKKKKLTSLQKDCLLNLKQVCMEF